MFLYSKRIYFRFKRCDSYHIGVFNIRCDVVPPETEPYLISNKGLISNTQLNDSLNNYSLSMYSFMHYLSRLLR